ncbi:hypothetical protein MtrunA17_Chr8g0390811 [Medicago truncatula]|uniref:Transmembrane protein, putative n=1 Tax=Medicago truncatula TaxID=3880 RepID=G7L909_MEDTR|nr:transmembrane protein, putative [Medicago truncatula]RHN43709.1 hypothetical protein MtrunA17_Chr8g0390811 [Medicago truncatula]
MTLKNPVGAMLHSVFVWGEKKKKKMECKPFGGHISVASFSALRPDRQACLHFMQNESSPRLLVLFESMIYRRCKPAIIGSVLIVLKLVMYNFLNMFEA